MPRRARNVGLSFGARPLRLIRGPRDYNRMRAELDRLWGAKPGTPEHDRLTVLGLIIEDYEKRRLPPVGPLDPVEVIEFYMDQRGYTKSDLGNVLGSPARASEILRRKRRLTVDMIRRLSAQWRIPAALLIEGGSATRRAA